MKRALKIYLVLLGTVILAGGGYGRDRSAPSRASYRVIGSDRTGITLEITPPRYRVESLIRNGRTYHSLRLPGYHPWSRAGKPDFPAAVIKVPLPGVERVTVRVRPEQLLERRALKLYCPPAREWTPEEVEAALEDGIFDDPARLAALSPEERELKEIKKSIRSAPPSAVKKAPARGSVRVAPIREPVLPPGLFPAQAVEVGIPYRQRERQYVNLLINPVRYLSSRRTIAYHPRIVVRLTYGSAARPDNWDYDAPYRKQFEIARAGCFKAMVNTDSIQEISYQDLLDAGFPLLTDPRNLKVYHLGEEIPAFIEGEDDGIWDPGDYLHFYGRAGTGYFSQTGVHWLLHDTSRGRRMEEVDFSATSRPQRQPSFLSPLHLEQNRYYFVDMPKGSSDDRWFWNFAGYYGSTSFTMETVFSLSGVSPEAAFVSFTGRLFGLTGSDSVDPDHHTRLTLNGTVIGDFLWDGQAEYVFQTDLPQALFVEGDNTVSVAEVADTGQTYEYVYVNSFDISYLHAFSSASGSLAFSTRDKTDYAIPGFTAPSLALYDITQPDNPQRIVGFSESGGPPFSLSFGRRDLGERSYLAAAPSALPHPALEEDQPSALDDPSRRLDYLVITPPLFAAAVQPLVDFRAARGLAVESFVIQDVYDTFSFGNLDPAAIRGFLQHAYRSYTPPAPAYALLVGSGHYDYRNYSGTARPNFLPPHLFASDYMETASDNWFACVSGDDLVPDYALGRLAVRTAAEASAFVQKIIDYENGSSGLPWQSRIQMVADDPDSGGDFPADSDALIDSSIPGSYTTDKAYLPTLGLTATRNAIRNGISAGRLIVHYMGHGANDRWATENIFNNATFSSLTNTAAWPLMSTMTCMNGYWCDAAAAACLAETMTKGAGKGMVAALSPSGFCLNNVSRRLSAFVLQDMLASGNKEIGPAIAESKAALAGLGAFEEIDLYHLFGDPALRLK